MNRFYFFIFFQLLFYSIFARSLESPINVVFKSNEITFLDVETSKNIYYQIEAEINYLSESYYKRDTYFYCSKQRLFDKAFINQCKTYLSMIPGFP